ncbi:MAG: family 78 glycoside hydrolase catalytic domain [Eubacteriales bacterium]|nr:family 78 glycoside hydrolase catalytic domain [Eubacteriales bacterium]
MSGIRNVRCENLKNPINIAVKNPRFSWEIDSDEKAVFQKSYRITVQKDGRLCWDSGWREDNRTFGIRYMGEELKSRTAYIYKIEAVLSNGETVYSQSCSFETVVFDNREWIAKFIEPDKLPKLEYEPLEECKEKWNEVVQKMMKGETAEFFDTDAYLKSQPCHPYHPAVMMYRKFSLPSASWKARVYMTAHGIYEFYINGVLASDVQLAPEFTTYDKILKYQVYDVTELLHAGENAVLAVVADGWYKGKICSGRGCEYGDNPGLFLEMDVCCADGSRQKLISDEKFVYSYDGPVRRADLYNGQTVDARYEIPGFATVNMDVQNWKPVHSVEENLNVLTAQADAPIRKLDELEAIEVFTNKKGETIVDFGQGFAGHIRVEGIKGTEGTEIVFEHTEQLGQEQQFIYPFADGEQKQKDIYILNGKGKECFEPSMTYHGFRYVKVTSSCEMIWKKEQFKGIVIGTDNELSGSFLCSDERLNRLQENIFWSQRSNMIGIPTDCPTREKAGWTGDVYVYAKTSCFNQNLLSFYEEWLKSVRKEQMENGGVQNTVPLIRNYVQQIGGASTGWGDVIVELPWQLYRIYGDRKVLEENYEAMKKWLSYLEGQAGIVIPDPSAHMTEREQENQRYLLNTGFHFGDWLVPSVTNEEGFADGPASSFLTGHTIATAIYADTTEKVGKIAEILGDEQEAEHCRKLSARIREAFEETYLQPDGRLKQDMQGVYVLALRMKMVSEEHRKGLLDRLVEKIKENGGCMDCGFMSVPHILDVLSENGKKEEAYSLLFQEKCPSWLYEIKQGATTMWESWNAIREDGSRDGCSFNHYAFGCVGDWMYRNILGIRNVGVGYDRIEICPDIFCGLDWAKGYFDCVHGRISVEWKKHENGSVHILVHIPENTSAVLRVGSITQEVGSGSFEIVEK